MNWISEIWAMKDGISQCWLVSEHCVIDWDAWSAIGTLLAVIAALRIANVDKVRRWAEADARAGVAYARLLVPIQSWTDNISLYAHLLQTDASACLSDAATAYSTQVPESVLQAAGDMRDLGPATESLVDAVLRMGEAASMQNDVYKIRADRALEGTLWAEEVMERYAWSVVSASRAAQTTRALMQIRLNRVTQHTPWKTRYIDSVFARYKQQGMQFPESTARLWLPGWLASRLVRWKQWRIEVKAYRGN